MTSLKAALCVALAACASAPAFAATTVYEGTCRAFCGFDRVDGVVQSVLLETTAGVSQSFIVNDPSAGAPVYRLTGVATVDRGTNIPFDVLATGSGSFPTASFTLAVPITQYLTDLAYFGGRGQFQIGVVAVPTYTYVSGSTIGPQTGGTALSSPIRLTINFTPFIPEPSTWALMLAGFGLTGYALRRRRSRVAFA